MYSEKSYTGEPQSCVEAMQSKTYKKSYFGNLFYKLSNMYTHSNGIYNEVERYYKIFKDTNESTLRISGYNEDM